ncbi:hypothetical protein BD779DRAFT_1497167 [Infundibulicybe gibba]|nr:hypothetical protein BD779DRAFT_1497167 [Infundibulicybe gibba]
MDVELGLVRQGRKSPPIFVKARRFRSASRPEIQEPTSKASKSECYLSNAHSAISGFLWDVPSAMVMAPVPLPTFTSTPPQTRIPSNKRISPVNNPNVYPDMFAMDADAFDESLHFPLSYALGGPTMDESEAEVRVMAGESAVVVSAGHKTLRPSGPGQPETPTLKWAQ